MENDVFSQIVFFYYVKVHKTRMFLCDVKHSSQECDQKEFLQEVGDNIRGMEEVSITIIITIIIITIMITIIIIMRRWCCVSSTSRPAPTSGGWQRPPR